MKHGLPDPVADAAVQPLRLAWDGVQLHAHPAISPEEIDGVVKRLMRLRDLQIRNKTVIIRLTDEHEIYL
jgi:hypothetical protein